MHTKSKTLRIPRVLKGAHARTDRRLGHTYSLVVARARLPIMLRASVWRIPLIREHAPHVVGAAKARLERVMRGRHSVGVPLRFQVAAPVSRAVGCLRTGWRKRSGGARQVRRMRAARERYVTLNSRCPPRCLHSFLLRHMRKCACACAHTKDTRLTKLFQNQAPHRAVPLAIKVCASAQHASASRTRLHSDPPSCGSHMLVPLASFSASAPLSLVAGRHPASQH